MWKAFVWFIEARCLAGKVKPLEENGLTLSQSHWLFAVRVRIRATVRVKVRFYLLRLVRFYHTKPTALSSCVTVTSQVAYESVFKFHDPQAYL